MSELQILRAGAEARAFAPLALFLAGVGIVFVGAMRHVVGVAWGEETCVPTADRCGAEDRVLVWGALGLLLLLGLWIPEPLRAVLEAAAAVVGGRS